MTDSLLVEYALKAMRNSYAPYSRFNVGAALLADDGKVYTGCNIENSSYGLSNCAERTAFYKAISEGAKKFKIIAIAGGRDYKVQDFCMPCGACRQVMSEFCDSDFTVIVINNLQEIKKYKMEEIFPLGFCLKE